MKLGGGVTGSLGDWPRTDIRSFMEEVGEFDGDGKDRSERSPRSEAMGAYNGPSVTQRGWLVGTDDGDQNVFSNFGYLSPFKYGKSSIRDYQEMDHYSRDNGRLGNRAPPLLELTPGGRVKLVGVSVVVPKPQTMKNGSGIVRGTWRG